MSGAGGGGQEITKTVAEWNEERRKLGLKPLRQTDDQGAFIQGSSDAPLDHWAEKNRRAAEKFDPKKEEETRKRKR